MTTNDLTPLSELAARFRSRAESAGALSMEYKLAVRAHDAAGNCFSVERDLDDTQYTHAAAAANTWGRAASELEAFLKTAEAQEVEARG